MNEVYITEKTDSFYQELEALELASREAIAELVSNIRKLSTEEYMEQQSILTRCHRQCIHELIKKYNLTN